jgi:hypothetical protein
LLLREKLLSKGLKMKVKINDLSSPGLYVRMAEATFEEAGWIYSLLSGFPGAHPPGLSGCLTLVERAERIHIQDLLDPSKPNINEFGFVPLILCLEDQTRIGLIILHYYNDFGQVWEEGNMLKVDKAIIHKDYRGQGYFSKFIKTVTAFFVNELKVTRSKFKVLTSAPQVLSSINYMSPAVGNRKSTPGWVEETDEVIIEYNTAKPSIDPTIPNISVEYDVDT